MTNRLLSSLALGLAVAPAALAQPTGYPSYGGMIAQMQTAAANFPAICRAVNVTQTYGAPKTWLGQDIWGVKISDNVGQNEDEPAFLMVANHHGNEYGTPIIALDTMNRLTTGYATDPQIRSYVDNNEIWILPTCNPDGYWTSRHNRRPGGGVDLNRNYPFSWGSNCNNGVRGPGPGSEPEVQNVLALSEAERFDKVIDFHTSGRETLYGYYQSCPNHVLLSYLRSEAIAISTASSYSGRVRGPSSDGEHYQHQIGVYGAYANLTETNTTHSPSITSAINEANRLWPGTQFILERPIPVWGHITDSVTGAPIEANITYVENPFTQGERNPSEPRFGRYHAFLPIGNHTLRVSAPCYITQDVPVTVTEASTQVEIKLVRDPSAGVGQVTVRNGSGVNDLCLSSQNVPVAGGNWNVRVDTSNHPTANNAAVVSFTTPRTGPVFPQGEVLVALGSTQVFWIVAPVQGGVASFSIPFAGGTTGFSATAQAMIAVGERGIALCNALDYVVGCQ